MLLFFAAFLLLRSARTLIGVTTIVVFWALGAGWLAQPLLDLAQRGAPPGGQTVAPTTYAARTAIVMLGTGTIQRDGKLVPPTDGLARIVKSADLYARCKRVSPVCHVIVSGGNPQQHEATEADTYLPYLLREGVPRGEIILENTSMTTYENARNVAAILPDGYYGSLILVTSAFQMPRALLDFHRFGIKPLPVVSNTRRATRGLLPRRANFFNAEIALHELIGIAQFYVYRQIGWF